MSVEPSSVIHYEIFGQGVPLILAFPVLASRWPGDPELAMRNGYLDRLTDRYRVMVLDYPPLAPNIGKSEFIPAPHLTADRVCSDLLATADAAGFERFAFWGFSFGGIMGLQLASRSERVSALACGGWPPLGAPYSEMLSITRAMAEVPDVPVRVDQFVGFYESVQGWPEAKAVGSIQCPRLTFVGSADEMEYPGGTKLRLAATIRERRAELEKLGWEVVEIPGRDHSVFTNPEAVVPVVREFLDRVV